MLDFDKTTTIKVYVDDVNYTNEKVPGTNTQERFHKLIALHQRQVKDKQFQKWMIKTMGKKFGETDEQIEEDLRKYTRDIL